MIAAGFLLLSFYTCAQASEDTDPYSDLVHMLTTGENENRPHREKQKVVSFGEYGEEVIHTGNSAQEDIDIRSTLDFLNASLIENHASLPDNFFYYDNFDYDISREEITPVLHPEDLASFQLPVPGYLTSQYGYRPAYHRVHRGVDLKLHVGDTVRAALPGRVRAVAYNRGGYGYYVVVTHANGLETLYGHLSGFIASRGDYVLAGDPIALGGSTGRSTGPHLHFEMRYHGCAFDPNIVYNFNTRSLRVLTKTSADAVRNDMPPMLQEAPAEEPVITPLIPSLTQSVPMQSFIQRTKTKSKKTTKVKKTAKKK